MIYLNADSAMNWQTHLTTYTWSEPRVHDHIVLMQNCEELTHEVSQGFMITLSWCKIVRNLHMKWAQGSWSYCPDAKLWGTYTWSELRVHDHIVLMQNCEELTHEVSPGFMITLSWCKIVRNLHMKWAQGSWLHCPDAKLWGTYTWSEPRVHYYIVLMQNCEELTHEVSPGFNITLSWCKIVRNLHMKWAQGSLLHCPDAKLWGTYTWREPRVHYYIVLM